MSPSLSSQRKNDSALLSSVTLPPPTTQSSTRRNRWTTLLNSCEIPLRSHCCPFYHNPTPRALTTSSGANPALQHHQAVAQLTTPRAREHNPSARYTAQHAAPISIRLRTPHTTLALFVPTSSNPALTAPCLSSLSHLPRLQQHLQRMPVTPIPHHHQPPLRTLLHLATIAHSTPARQPHCAHVRH